MSKLQTFLGYPEPDAGVPFALWFPLETDAILIAGVFNRGPEGVADLQSKRIDLVAVENLMTHMTENGLQSTNPMETVWWMRETFGQLALDPFEEWEIIELLCETPMAPSFLSTNNGLYNPSVAHQTTEIVHPETGVFFPLPEGLLSDGVKGISVVVQNDKEVQQTLLDAVVESCADMAMDDTVYPQVRTRWSLALMALSLIYDAQNNPVTRDIAEHNRRAIQMGAVGSQIPFVRVWTMQQLVNSVAIAQMMAHPDDQS